MMLCLSDSKLCFVPSVERVLWVIASAFLRSLQVGTNWLRTLAAGQTQHVYVQLRLERT